MGMGKLAAGLGIGLVAGFAGTVTMTAGQMIEMRLRGREPSPTPAKAVEKVMRIEPKDERAEAVLANEVHFAYGTAWGAGLTVLDALGLRGWPATAVHFVAITGTAFVMLPALKVAPPVKEWGAKEIAIDVAHHAVYAIATGVAYTALKRSLIAELPRSEAARGALGWGAIGAALAAMAMRPRRKAPKLRITWLKELPAEARDRWGRR